jgi:MazG family protein
VIIQDTAAHAAGDEVIRMDEAEKAGRYFADLVRILDRLRGDDGCPWDRRQDVKSIINYFLEEAYEVVDAVFHGGPSDVAEELGDMLMEIVFLARLHSEKSAFHMAEVVEGINRKMIRRHPHVFGDREVSGADEVMAAWSRQKNSEKRRESLFDGVSPSDPALLVAFQIGLRASQNGFDWPDRSGVVEKIGEEAGELAAAFEESDPRRMMEEMGDLLFAMANLSRRLGVNPEIALHFANRKFIRRFQFIEGALREAGRSVEDASLEEMDALWERSKAESPES